MGALASILMLAAPAMAFASSNISNIKFDNGQTTFSCTAGESVNVTFRVVVPAGEVAEIGQTDVISDSLAPSLPFQLGGELGLQEGPNDVSTSVTCPQNTGYYTVELRTAGIFGGLKAIAITDGVTSLGSFSNALRVVASASGSSSTGSTGSSALDQLSAAVAALAAQVNALLHPVTPPAPTGDAKCVAIQPFLSAPGGTYSAAGVQLQSSLLLDNPYAIPALKPGSSVPMGFRGPQTEAALSQYLALHHC